MAARRALKKPYRICQGTITHEITAAEFAVALANRYTRLSKGDPRLAHVNARFEMHVEHATGRMLFRLAERPEVDPAGVPSWWPRIVERHGRMFGAANETLYSWAAQTEGIH